MIAKQDIRLCLVWSGFILTLTHIKYRTTQRMSEFQQQYPVWAGFLQDQISYLLQFFNRFQETYKQEQ